VGTSVGAAEGASVGAADGASVGVGAAVGVSVGLPVGSFAGAANTTANHKENINMGMLCTSALSRTTKSYQTSSTLI
jgi:hypothetical protein